MRRRDDGGGRAALASPRVYGPRRVPPPAMIFPPAFPPPPDIGLGGRPADLWEQCTAIPTFGFGPSPGVPAPSFFHQPPPASVAVPQDLRCCPLSRGAVPICRVPPPQPSAEGWYAPHAERHHPPPLRISTSEYNNPTGSSSPYHQERRQSSAGPDRWAPSRVPAVADPYRSRSRFDGETFEDPNRRHEEASRRRPHEVPPWRTRDFREKRRPSSDRREGRASDERSARKRAPALPLPSECARTKKTRSESNTTKQESSKVKHDDEGPRREWSSAESKKPRDERLFPEKLKAPSSEEASFTLDVAGDEDLEIFLEEPEPPSLSEVTRPGEVIRSVQKQPYQELRGRGQGRTVEKRETLALRWGREVENTTSSVAEVLGPEFVKDFTGLLQRFTLSLLSQGVLIEASACATPESDAATVESMSQGESQFLKEVASSSETGKHSSSSSLLMRHSSRTQLFSVNTVCLEREFNSQQSSRSSLASIWSVLGGGKDGSRIPGAEAMNSRGGRYFATLKSQTDQKDVFPDPSVPASLEVSSNTSNCNAGGGEDRLDTELELEGGGNAHDGAFPPSSSSSSLALKTKHLKCAAPEAEADDDTEAVSWFVGDFVFFPMPQRLPARAEHSRGRTKSSFIVLHLTRGGILRSHAFTLAMHLLPRQLCLFCGAESCPRSADRRVSCRDALCRRCGAATSHLEGRHRCLSRRPWRADLAFEEWNRRILDKLAEHGGRDCRLRCQTCQRRGHFLCGPALLKTGLASLSIRSNPTNAATTLDGIQIPWSLSRLRGFEAPAVSYPHQAACMAWPAQPSPSPPPPVCEYPYF